MAGLAANCSLWLLGLHGPHAPLAVNMYPACNTTYICFRCTGCTEAGTCAAVS